MTFLLHAAHRPWAPGADEDPMPRSTLRIQPGQISMVLETFGENLNPSGLLRSAAIRSRMRYTSEDAAVYGL